MKKEFYQSQVEKVRNVVPKLKGIILTHSALPRLSRDMNAEHKHPTERHYTTTLRLPEAIEPRICTFAKHSFSDGPGARDRDQHLEIDE